MAAKTAVPTKATFTTKLGTPIADAGTSKPSIHASSKAGQ